MVNHSTLVNTLVEIDGSYGEGGGSILRLALPLAVATKTPLKITNIRANRKNPGLRAQHLAGLKLVESIIGGELKGAKIGSKTIEYFPPQDLGVASSIVKTEVPTAGSIGLICQILQNLALAVRHEFQVEIIGGATHGKWAPTLEYLNEITFPLLKHFGLAVSAQARRYGFYPQGGARVTLSFQPNSSTSPLILTRPVEPSESNPKIISIESKHLHKASVAERQYMAAIKFLEMQGIHANDITQITVNSISPGSSILVYHRNDNVMIGADNIGERGVPAQEVGKKAAKAFYNELNAGATLDIHAADQILLPAILSRTPFHVFVQQYTSHARTNMWVVQHFMPEEKIAIRKEGSHVELKYDPSENS